jgi:uncharacterized OsmC-like protein
MSNVVSQFSIHVESVGRYEFRVRFDGPEHALLATDEPPPLGQNRGPNPSRLLGAAVANCLASSLTFCLERNGAPSAVSADASVEIIRNERNRLRVGRIAVKLRPSATVDRDVLARCLTQFEDFCVVTESVRRGLDVVVEVEPPDGPPMASKTEESR